MDWKNSITMQLHMLMGSVHKASAQSFEQLLNDSNINLSMLQVRIMRILQYEGDMTPSELSRKLMLDPSTLVPTVNGLVDKTYVERNRDPNDRRRIILSLTTNGKKLSDRLWEIPHEHIVVKAVEKMEEDDARQLLQLMQQLVSNLPDGDHILEQIDLRLKPIIEKGTTNICKPHNS